MSESLPDQFELLGQLAKEYHRKYHELKQALAGMLLGEQMTQFKGLGEMSIDRFRGAQQALLKSLAAGEPTDSEWHLQAVMALSYCFDEMCVLFQIMLETLEDRCAEPSPA